MGRLALRATVGDRHRGKLLDRSNVGVATTREWLAFRLRRPTREHLRLIQDDESGGHQRKPQTSVAAETSRGLAPNRPPTTAVAAPTWRAVSPIRQTSGTHPTVLPIFSFPLATPAPPPMHELDAATATHPIASYPVARRLQGSLTDPHRIGFEPGGDVLPSLDRDRSGHRWAGALGCLRGQLAASRESLNHARLGRPESQPLRPAPRRILAVGRTCQLE